MSDKYPTRGSLENAIKVAQGWDKLNAVDEFEIAAKVTGITLSKKKGGKFGIRLLYFLILAVAVGIPIFTASRTGGDPQAIGMGILIGLALAFLLWIGSLFLR